MVEFKRFVGLITFECCCWNTLLTANATCWIAWNTLPCLMFIFSFYRFLLLWMVSVPMICFRPVSFLKATMRSVLKFFLKLWFECNMCQGFVGISFKFGNDRLYNTDKGMHCLSWPLLIEQLFSIEFVNLVNLLYGNFSFVSFINKLFNTFDRVNVLFLECWAYSSNSKCLAVGNTFTDSMDVPISRQESFDGHLVFGRE